MSNSKVQRIGKDKREGEGICNAITEYTHGGVLLLFD